MKKSLTMMAIAIAAMMGFSASAQTPQDMNKMRQPREFTEFAFEGILLDINQQTRIDSLNAAVKANAPMPKHDKAPMGKRDKADKAKCDKQCDKAKCDKPCDKQCDKAKCDKPCDKQCDKAKCDKPCDKANADKPCMKAKGDKPCDKAVKGPKGKGPHMGNNPYGEEYMAKVKEILTPEQYTIFLENIVNMQPAPKMGHKGAPSQKQMMERKAPKAPKKK